MGRKQMKIRVLDDGGLEVLDPVLEQLPLLKSIDPDFEIQQSNLPGFVSPRFIKSRQIGCGLTLEELKYLDYNGLLEIHETIIPKVPLWKDMVEKRTEEASLLDLKIALARKMMTQCRLCGRVCSINRLIDEPCLCGLGEKAVVAEHFIHIGEEPPINPSLLISLYGCGLRCKFCQQGALLDQRKDSEEYLEPSLWQRLDAQGARSLSFIGGNPDESIYSVLLFLKHAPEDFALPIVWNSNAFATTDAVRLLDGIVDVYVPDFKFGNENCGRTLAGASNYPAVAKIAISQMLFQDVPVIVRILVLPGHFECCHKPIIETLALMKNENLLVSVRGQYFPDWKITEKDGPLFRRPTHEEIEIVMEKVVAEGLKSIG